MDNQWAARGGGGEGKMGKCVIRGLDKGFGMGEEEKVLKGTREGEEDKCCSLVKTKG